MKRFNPFSGIQVSLFDATYWTSETASAVKQRINSDLYNQGAVNGLTVFESGTRAGTVAVTLGVGYDVNGERIGVPVLQDQITYSGALLNDTSTYQITARYSEGNDGTSGLDVDGISNFRHVTDGYALRALKVGVDSAATGEFVLAQVRSATAGATLIVDSTVRDVFSAKYAATGTNLQVANLALGGSLIVGGCITSLMGGSFASMFVGNGGLSVTGTACFFRVATGMSNIEAKGDFIALTPGKGLLLTSPDGTKRARIFLDNDGFMSQDPLNYTLS